MHADYGVVPAYLEERKAKWAVENEAKRKAAEIAAACPSGHRMMPEEERVATLELVSTSLAEAKAMVRRTRRAASHERTWRETSVFTRDLNPSPPPPLSFWRFRCG